jgi:hypothetical protein
MPRRGNVVLGLYSRQAGRTRLLSLSRAINPSATAIWTDPDTTYTSITQHGVDQEW